MCTVRGRSLAVWLPLFTERFRMGGGEYSRRDGKRRYEIVTLRSRKVNKHEGI